MGEVVEPETGRDVVVEVDDGDRLLAPEDRVVRAERCRRSAST
jgi:hypothetical protein